MKKNPKAGVSMQELSASNLLVLALAAMYIWLCVNVLISVVRLNRSYDLRQGRYLHPANCPPERCRDVTGFIRFATPRFVLFAVLGLLLSVFYLVNELTGLLSALPDWLSNGAALFLFIPLFIWYVIFINKAAKRFW